MTDSQPPVYVTCPSLPPLDEFYAYLQDIWRSRMITNNGNFLQEFEKALAEYLGVRHLSVVANGTLALLIALKALEIEGEVITTPFSFVATAHSILWSGLTPVFADIDEQTFNLDPDRVEKVISPRTRAILPVHVYGNPCDVNGFKQLSKAHGLRLIYDAAHAFGVKWKGATILEYGDLSVLSFHATKVFNTVEGGAIISQNQAMKNRIDRMRNFGFSGETQVMGVGINAKMNELQSAYGLLQLKYIDRCVDQRKVLAARYLKDLSSVPGISVAGQLPDVDTNYGYLPIRVDREAYGKTRDQLYERLKSMNIFCRRYFYPLITAFSPYQEMVSAKRENLPVATKVAEQILCLPLFHDMEERTLNTITRIIEDFR